MSVEVWRLAVCADAIRSWFGFYLYVGFAGDLADAGRGVHSYRSVGLLSFPLCLALHVLPCLRRRTVLGVFYRILLIPGLLVAFQRLIKLQGWDPLMVLNTKIQKCILYILFPDLYIRIVCACVFRVFGVDCSSSRVPAGRGVFTNLPCWCQLCVCFCVCVCVQEPWLSGTVWC